MNIVVACYRENLNWLSGFEDCRIHVYDKSPSSARASQQCLPSSAEVTHLPNVGREAHTYLTHIINRYDSLADVTVFLQGDPHDHVRHLKQQLDEVPTDPGFRELGHTPVVEDGAGNPSQPGIDSAGLYRALFRSHPPAFYPFHSGANFAVSRAAIRRRPLEFYQRALTAVLSSRSGPWEIERVWPRIFFPTAPRSGIVTAATADIFFDTQQLLQSLERFGRCPVEVFDLGLTDSQKEWVEKHPQRTLRQRPRWINRVSRLQQIREWPTWLKPFYILHSRFDRVLWIDADCVVLRDPAAAFEFIRKQPLVVIDTTKAAVCNHPSLYDELPAGDVDASVRLNAGIVGLDRHRDAELLGAWAWAVQWAARNLRLRNRFRWFDQGALLWALQRLSMTSVISSDTTWNTPWLTEENPVEQSFVSGVPLSELLKLRFPSAGIVHFLGKQKLLRQCQRLIDGELGKAGNLQGPPSPIERNPS
jgi:hypothetical protein